jgi:Ice-binding-like
VKTLSIFLLSAVCSFAQANVPLGTAANFGVLASSTVTNTGATPITGSVGVSPGSAITGFPPGIVTGGAIDAGDATAATAQSDLTVAYLNAAGQMRTRALTGLDLGGLTLPPGVYFFSSSAQLTGTLTLNGAGFYIFQIGSTLTTASGSIVRAINGAQAANVFWQVGSSATLGTGTTFIGNILAMTSITANTGDVIAGRLLARGGAVTLDMDTINFPLAIPPGGLGGPPTTPPPTPPATPAPSSGILVLIGVACAMLYQTRKRWLRGFVAKTTADRRDY